MWSKIRNYPPGEIQTLETQSNINFVQENILIDTKDGKPVARLGDFGISYATIRVLDNVNLLRDSFYYMAPELKKAGQFREFPTKESDIYSFGRTIEKVCSPYTMRSLR